MEFTTSIKQEEAYVPRGRVLVTGGAGFIGSHVVDLLLALNPEYRMTVLDSMEYVSSRHFRERLTSASGIRSRVEFVHGDIRDAHLLARIIKGGMNKDEEKRGDSEVGGKMAVDTVLHFAAQTHVDNSFGNSLAFTLANTYGTHVLLEACRLSGTVRRFVYVSTDEVYGDTSVGLDVGLTEKTGHVDPTNPYSAAKASAEMMCRAYMTSFGMPIIITRGNNVFGPRQFPEKLVPKFVMLALRGAPMPVHGDGRSKRSYLYVEDVARAFHVVLHRGRTGETYNIGSVHERTVLDVANDVARDVAREVKKIQKNKGGNGNNDVDTDVFFVKDRAFNDKRYFIGSDKLIALGWREEVGWEKGLAKTIRWYAEENCDAHWSDKAIGEALSS